MKKEIKEYKKFSFIGFFTHKSIMYIVYTNRYLIKSATFFFTFKMHVMWAWAMGVFKKKSLLKHIKNDQCKKVSKVSEFFCALD